MQAPWKDLGGPSRSLAVSATVLLISSALAGAGLHALDAGPDRGGGEADAPVREAGDQGFGGEAVGLREEGDGEVSGEDEREAV